MICPEGRHLDGRDAGPRCRVKKAELVIGSALRFSWSQAFALSAVLAGMGCVLHSLQLIALRREFGAGGLLDWGVLRTSHPGLLRSGFARWTDPLFSPPAVLLLSLAQAGGSIVIVSRPSDPPVWALCVVVGVRNLFNFRNSPAIIGADQMQVLVLAACLLYFLVPESGVAQACGWFVCLQMIVAYVTAGVSKLVTPAWRRGSAITDILRSRNTGLALAYAYVRRFPVLASLMCWATIVVEIAFPWLVFGGPSACVVFLATGVLFHVGVAIIMGFDEFLWAYLATYPIALRCSIEVARLWWG